jgi:transcriptional regulator
MRVRDSFKPSNEQTQAFLARASWATIISTRADAVPTATHVPVLCKHRAEESGGWVVEAHIARSNPHWEFLQDGAPTLCILQGAHCYVSSAWYKKPSAPTWNYQSVHLTGRAHLVENQAAAAAHLRELIVHHEGEAVAQRMDAVVTPETFEKLLPAIVAFRIEVDEIDSALKMSQNKDDATHTSIVEHIEQRDAPLDAEVAQIMRSLRTT